MQENKTCCICFENEPDIQCSTCIDGNICTICFEQMVDNEDIICPICRKPIWKAIWYMRINQLLSEYCYLGFMWIVGYIALYCAIDGVQQNKYILTWGCIAMGVFVIKYLGLICYGIVQELDEEHIQPFIVPNQSEEQYLENLEEYRQYTNSKCYTKCLIHLLAREMDGVYHLTNVQHNQIDMIDSWVHTLKVATVVIFPFLGNVYSGLIHLVS